MTPNDVRTILTILATAHDRAIPDGLADIWAVTLADVSFDDGKAAAIELLQTSPYFPKVADMRERARLFTAERERAQQRQRQLEGRDQIAPHPTRTGADMVRHVLGRLKDAGQDPGRGKFLGVERAAAIAEEACEEWLDRTFIAERQPT